MEVKMPTIKNEINLNTLLIVFTLAGVLLSVGGAWTDVKGDVETLQTWQNDHDDWHKTRSIESRTRDGEIGAQIKALETAVAIQVQSDYRLAQAEKNIEVLNERINIQAQRQDTSVNDIRKDMSALSTQIELSKQILLRLEAKQTNRMLDNPPTELRGKQG